MREEFPLKTLRKIFKSRPSQPAGSPQNYNTQQTQGKNKQLQALIARGIGLLYNISINRNLYTLGIKRIDSERKIYVISR